MDTNSTTASSRGLAFFEIVRFESDDPEFAEINGLQGHVAGKGAPEDNDVAVYFYDIERVWCVPANLCISQGRIDDAEKARSERARALLAEKYRE